MKTHPYTEQEIKCTAVIYATRAEIVEHIQTTGKLPENVAVGGFPTAMNYLLRTKGVNLLLSEKEELVFNAIINEKRLPAGGVVLFPNAIPIYSIESDQKIEILPPPRNPDWE